MQEISKDTVALLTFLLPGFLVAWFFYALTSHQKPAQLERVIQALIFTLFVKLLVLLERMTLEYIGTWWAITSWGTGSELVASLVSAIPLGFGAAYIANNDALHAFLRAKKISKRSSHPSEWCCVFAQHQLYIILNLKDERRLYGWPEVWPSDPDKGHFFIINGSWINDPDNVDLPSTEGILVDVKDIKFIEFIKTPMEKS